MMMNRERAKTTLYCNIYKIIPQQIQTQYNFGPFKSNSKHKKPRCFKTNFTLYLLQSKHIVYYYINL
jgi:hypothetical protein